MEDSNSAILQLCHEHNVLNLTLSCVLYRLSTPLHFLVVVLTFFLFFFYNSVIIVII